MPGLNVLARAGAGRVGARARAGEVGAGDRQAADVRLRRLGAVAAGDRLAGRACPSRRSSRARRRLRGVVGVAGPAAGLAGDRRVAERHHRSASRRPGRRRARAAPVRARRRRRPASRAPPTACPSLLRLVARRSSPEGVGAVNRRAASTWLIENATPAGSAITAERPTGVSNGGGDGGAAAALGARDRGVDVVDPEVDDPARALLGGHHHGDDLARDRLLRLAADVAGQAEHASPGRTPRSSSRTPRRRTRRRRRGRRVSSRLIAHAPGSLTSCAPWRVRGSHDVEAPRRPGRRRRTMRPMSNSSGPAITLPPARSTRRRPLLGGLDADLGDPGRLRRRIEARRDRRDRRHVAAAQRRGEEAAAVLVLPAEHGAVVLGGRLDVGLHRRHPAGDARLVSITLAHGGTVSRT